VLVGSQEPPSDTAFMDSGLNSISLVGPHCKPRSLATNSRRGTRFSSLCGVHSVGELRGRFIAEETGLLSHSTLLPQSFLGLARTRTILFRHFLESRDMHLL